MPKSFLVKGNSLPYSRSTSRFEVRDISHGISGMFVNCVLCIILAVVVNLTKSDSDSQVNQVLSRFFSCSSLYFHEKLSIKSEQFHYFKKSMFLSDICQNLPAESQLKSKKGGSDQLSLSSSCAVGYFTGSKYIIGEKVGRFLCRNKVLESRTYRTKTKQKTKTKKKINRQEERKKERKWR